MKYLDAMMHAMHYLSSLDAATWIALGTALALVALIALELYNGWRVRALAYPAYEYARKRAEEEAKGIVERARADTHKLLQEAQTETRALAGTRSGEEKAAIEAYTKALHTMLEQLAKDLEARITALKGAIEKTDETASARINEYAKQAEARFKDSVAAFDEERSKRIEEEAKKAFEEARVEAAHYERARKEVVDARIHVLVGETMKIVFRRSLPEEVHADLVRAALDEAKASNVF
jgi:vacuolar-type H+-ATPase subunit H